MSSEMLIAFFIVLIVIAYFVFKKIKQSYYEHKRDEIQQVLAMVMLKLGILNEQRTGIINTLHWQDVCEYLLGQNEVGIQKVFFDNQGEILPIHQVEYSNTNTVLLQIPYSSESQYSHCLILLNSAKDNPNFITARAEAVKGYTPFNDEALLY